MTENEISKIIINTCYDIHVELGPGLFESVYEEILYFELTSKRLKVERQKAIPVIWKNRRMELGFRGQTLLLKTKLLLNLNQLRRWLRFTKSNS